MKCNFISSHRSRTIVISLVSILGLIYSAQQLYLLVSMPEDIDEISVLANDMKFEDEEKNHKSLFRVNKINVAYKSNDKKNQRTNEDLNWNIPENSDEDLQSFLELMSSWPDQKPKAAVYYLVQSRRIDSLVSSLSSLDNYFNNQYNYPVIIFHEDDLLKVHHALIRSKTTSRLFFQRITFEIPPYLNRSAIIFDIPCLSHISYRHMCRFHAKLIYEQPIMAKLQYGWRLDDDSELLQPIGYDVFRWMQERSIQYGYILIHYDSLLCTKGLWDAVESYIKLNNIRSQFEWKEPMIYYNNFELSDLSIWTSPLYKRFIDYIDRLGGIFYHRWGDAPIKSLAVSLFVPENKTHYFLDVAYKHVRFFNHSFIW